MDKKIKVAVFIRGFHNGGIEKVFENYFSHMDLSPFEIHMITHMENDPGRKKVFTDMGCIVHELSPIRGSKINITNIREYRKLFREQCFNVVHNNMPEIILPLIYAKKYNVPIRINHAHNEYTKQVTSKLKYLVYKRVYVANASMATVLLGSSKNAAMSAFFEKSKEAVILPNAIDVGAYMFRPDARIRIRKELGIEKKFVIGHVGRYENEVKNQSLIVEAFKRVNKVNPNTHLVLIGEGKLRSTYMQEVKKCGISNDVTFTGAVNNVSDYLMAMDLFVFPSKQEGLGIAAVEAQVAGLPCLMSDQVPKEARITETVTSLPIYGDNAIQVWTDEILKYVESNINIVRSDCSKQARDAGFDIDEQAGRLAKIYLNGLG